MLMSDKNSEEQGIEFNLDGRTVRARPGETVLSVARRHGIDIPALCHHESVAPYASCRLCVVEAFWGKRSKLVTSCIYTPWPDERIETNTDRVRRSRRMTLELLLARCPEAEVIADLVREYGAEESRFSSRKDSGANDKCILCGLCVRVCAEVIGQNAIGYANRGSERVIATPFEKQAEECIGCGACVFVCPTGALSYEDIGSERIMKELKTKIPLVKCRACGNCFATEKQIARIKEKLNLPDDLAATCPRCRGAEFVQALEKCLVSAKDSSCCIKL